MGCTKNHERISWKKLETKFLSGLIKKIDETGSLDRKVGSGYSGNKLGTNQPGLY